jgi:hypothetical protein
MEADVPVEVIDNHNIEMQGITRVGPGARVQSQVAFNRMAAIVHRTRNTVGAIARVYGDSAQAAERGLHDLDHHDATMTRLGTQAAQEHQIAKENLVRRQQQVAERAAQVLAEVSQRDLDELMAQPDSAFYQPTKCERLSAWVWEGTSIELQRRNLPALSLGESLKELVVGGVVSAKAAAYDQRQITERRDRLALHQQLIAMQAQLAERAARPVVSDRGAPPVLPDEFDDELLASADAVEELLRQVQSPRQHANANGRLEVRYAE